MPEGQPSKHVGLKTIAISAIGALVSLGLCGAGFYLGRNIHDGAPPTLDIIGGFLFVACVVGFLVGILIAISEAIASASEKDKP